MTADKAALQMGFERDDRRRVRAGLLHALQRESNEGHSLAGFGRLVELARALLREPLARGALEGALEDLLAKDEIVLEDEFLGDDLTTELDETSPNAIADETAAYLPWLYSSERGLAQSLNQLLEQGVSPLADDAALAKAEAAAEIQLDPGQREAVTLL